MFQLEQEYIPSKSTLEHNTKPTTDRTAILEEQPAGKCAMAKGLIWATAEDMARNKGRVLSLYRQILRSLNSPDLPLNLAARLAKKAEARAIFMFGSEETSIHNIEDLIDTGEYALSALSKGEIPKYALI
ncbi:hypothetical protein OROGR_023894 [Orobanche gracilis]